MPVARGSQHRRARKAVLAYATHCTYCGTPISDALPVGHPQKAEVDHIIPLRYGGPDRVENYAPCCHRCNCRRGARDIKSMAVDLVEPGNW